MYKYIIIFTLLVCTVLLCGMVLKKNTILKYKTTENVT